MLRPSALRLNGANNDPIPESADTETPEAPPGDTPPDVLPDGVLSPVVLPRDSSTPAYVQRVAPCRSGVIKPIARRLDMDQSLPDDDKPGDAIENVADEIMADAEKEHEVSDKMESTSAIESDRPMLGKTRQKSVTFDIGDNEGLDDDLGDDDSFYDSTSMGAASPRSSTPNARSPMSSDSPRLGRIFSACHFSFDYDSATAMYRPYVDRSLKHLGLRKMTLQLYHLLGPTLDKAKAALSKPDVMKHDMESRRHRHVHVQVCIVGNRVLSQRVKG